MDASLNTQSKSCGLVMKDIEIFEDGSGGVCILEIQSAPFAASTRFFFDSPPLGAFVENLAALDRSLLGEAKLGQQFEDPHFMFRGNGRGQITVSGLLVDTTEHWQKLEFSFATDQTALGPFLAELRRVVDAAAT